MATKPKTTAVAVKASANIVSIAETLKAQAAALAGRTAPASGNVIRISQDKNFLMPDGTKSPGPLELVVVDFTSKNVYYPDGFDPKNIVPPTCFAIGADIKSMVPSKNSPINQNAGSDCASCAMNQWESDPKGGRGKACKNSRMLAVLPPVELDAKGKPKTAVADMQLLTMTVSPTATKSFDAFVTSTARIFESSPVGVIVTVGFNPNETYPSLMFGNDPAINEHVGDYMGRQDEAKALLTVEPDVSGWVAPAKGAKAKAVGRR